MFIVTANLVKPVSPDDLPQMRGVDGLKNGSPLGVEPKGEGIEGTHGFSTGSGNTSSKVEPSQPAEPKAKTGAKAGAKAERSTAKSVEVPKTTAQLDMAPAVVAAFEAAAEPVVRPVP
jgi:hypothetical protein